MVFIVLKYCLTKTSNKLLRYIATCNIFMYLVYKVNNYKRRLSNLMRDLSSKILFKTFSISWTQLSEKSTSE